MPNKRSIAPLAPRDVAATLMRQADQIAALSQRLEEIECLLEHTFPIGLTQSVIVTQQQVSANQDRLTHVEDRLDTMQETSHAVCAALHGQQSVQQALASIPERDKKPICWGYVRNERS